MKQENHDYMVSKTSPGCLQCKPQSQGTSQDQCVRFMAVPNKYYLIKKNFLYKYIFCFLARPLQQTFLLLLGKSS